MTRTSGHDSYRIDPSIGDRRVRHAAVCVCGWRSRLMPSAGLAGAVWDGHAAMFSPESCWPTM